MLAAALVVADPDFHTYTQSGAIRPRSIADPVTMMEERGGGKKIEKSTATTNAANWYPMARYS